MLSGVHHPGDAHVGTRSFYRSRRLVDQAQHLFQKRTVQSRWQRERIDCAALSHLFTVEGFDHSHCAGLRRNEISEGCEAFATLCMPNSSLGWPTSLLSIGALRVAATGSRTMAASRCAAH